MVDAQLLFKSGLLPQREHGERCILQLNFTKNRDYSPKSH